MVERRWRDDPELVHTQAVLDEAEAILDEAAQNMQQLPTLDYVERVKRKSDRNRNIVLAGVGLVAALALIIGSFAFRDSTKNAAQLAVNNSAMATYDQAIQELRSQGVPESELPPPPITPTDSQEIDIAGLVSATKAAVLADIRGDPSFRGPEGRMGPNGIPCDPAIFPECVGPEGAEGQPGTPGDNGPKGDTGDTGAPGRGIAATTQNPDDPCQRIVSYSDGTTETWNTCPPPPAEPDNPDGP